MALRDLKVGDELTPEENAELDASFAALTPDQQWDNFFSGMKWWFLNRGLTVDDARKLFDVGITTRHILLGPAELLPQKT